MAQESLNRLPLAERHIDVVLDYDDFIEAITADEYERILDDSYPDPKRGQFYSRIIDLHYEITCESFESYRRKGERFSFAYFLLHIFKHGYIWKRPAEGLYQHGLIDILCPNEQDTYIELTSDGQRSIDESLCNVRVRQDVFPLIDSFLSSADNPCSLNHVYMTKSVLDYHRKWRGRFYPTLTLSLNSV